MEGEVQCGSTYDPKKWYQKIIKIRPEDNYNTKRIMIELPFLTISTMDYFKFSADFCLDIDGIMFAVSVPYLRIWIGKKVWHRFSKLGKRKTIGEKERS